MESELGILSKISVRTARSIAQELRSVYLEDRAIFTVDGLESRLKVLLNRHKIGCYSMTTTTEKQGYIKAVINLFATEVVFRVFYNQYNVIGVSAAYVKTEIL